MAIDSSGNAYVTGSTASANFPATVGALQGLRAGTGPIEDAFVSKIGPLDAPAVALTPPHLTFTDQATGTTSAAQTVTVTNAGSAPLTISSIAVSGDFGQTNTCGGGLAAGGASCTISATFTPTATGDLEGAVTLTDDAAGSPHVVSLKGTGVTPAPAVSLTPSSLTFPEQTVGTTSDPQTISLTNSGSADLTITEISTGGDFAQSNDCPGTLGPGAGCTITVTFTPTASGDFTTAVLVTSDAAGSPHAATLSGTGLAVFSLSAPQTAVTVDRGTDSVTFTIAASAPSDFTSSISLSCVSTGSAACAFEPASITPGSSATLTVSELDNVATTSLDFSVDGTSGEQTAALPLTIQFAEFTLSVSPAFAAIAAGEAAVYTLTVTPTNGFTGEVSFGCSLLPSEASCSFLPDSITLDGSNPATIEVSLRTTERSRLAPPPPPPRTVPVLLILVTLAGLLMLAGAARPSLPRRAAPAAAVLFCALLLLSCGGIEFRPIRGTPSGTYQFWILAASGEIAQSVTASVTVN